MTMTPEERVVVENDAVIVNGNNRAGVVVTRQHYAPFVAAAIRATIADAEAVAVAAERERCAKAVKLCTVSLMERCQEIPGGMVYASVVAEAVSNAEIAICKPPAESDDGQSGESFVQSCVLYVREGPGAEPWWHLTLKSHSGELVFETRARHLATVQDARDDWLRSDRGQKREEEGYRCLGCGRVFESVPTERYEDGHGGRQLDMCRCGCDLFEAVKPKEGG